MAMPVSSLPNLGPAMESACARAGIDCAEQLRDIGTDESYRRLLRSGTQPHFIGYYVLEMALQGRPWNDCRGAEKAALRERFDAIKAECFDSHRAAFEAQLDMIGVVQERREDT